MINVTGGAQGVAARAGVRGAGRVPGRGPGPGREPVPARDGVLRGAGGVRGGQVVDLLDEADPARRGVVAQRGDVERAHPKLAHRCAHARPRGGLPDQPRCWRAGRRAPAWPRAPLSSGLRGRRSGISPPLRRSRGAPMRSWKQKFGALVLVRAERPAYVQRRDRPGDVEEPDTSSPTASGVVSHHAPSWALAMGSCFVRAAARGGFGPGGHGGLLRAEEDRAASSWAKSAASATSSGSTGLDDDRGYCFCTGWLISSSGSPRPGALYPAAAGASSVPLAQTSRSRRHTLRQISISSRVRPIGAS